MRVTFLGTGTSQGVPVAGCPCEICASGDSRDKRLRSSLLIEHEDRVMVIDSGPDFRYQLLRENVKRLDAVIFTHEHRDHTGGLDDIRPFNFLQGSAVHVYAHRRVQDALKRHYDYIFSEHRYPGIPEIHLHEIKDVPFEAFGVTFEPIEVLHYKLPVLGFRMGDFTYITDANYISEQEKAKIRGSKHLVLNALRIEKHLSHFNLDQAVELARELECENTWLTHISHQLGFAQNVEATLPEGIRLAYDGLKIEL